MMYVHYSEAMTGLPLQTKEDGWLTNYELQGFEALLEPFYGGKSLTDPIDTAKVWFLL